MAIHNRAYTRAKTWSKANRKFHIDRSKKSSGTWPLAYDNLHQYADNKIHCSCRNCPMYGSKTNNKHHNRAGARGYEPSKNWSISDRKKLTNLYEQIEEEEENDELV